MFNKSVKSDSKKDMKAIIKEDDDEFFGLKPSFPNFTDIKLNKTAVIRAESSSTADSTAEKQKLYTGKIQIKNISNDLKNMKTKKRKFSAPENDKKEDEFEMKIAHDSFGLNYTNFNKLENYELTESGSKGSKKIGKPIFLFDWDDTFLCTSVLSPNGYFDDDMQISNSLLQKIKDLGIYVKKLLVKSTESGDTYIITNSEAGWVEYSCNRFFPESYETLKKIKIISAREEYEKLFPKNTKKWKAEAFENITNKYVDGKITNLPINIICMGDSINEIEAARGLEKKFPKSFIKTIKFKEGPKIEEIIMQLNLILDKYEFLCNSCNNWTIKVEKKSKDSSL